MATPHLPATHCYPVAALVKTLKHDDGTLRILTAAEVKAVQLYLMAGRASLPFDPVAFDTAAVLFTPDDRAFVFLGVKGRICTVMTQRPDDVRDFLRHVLGDAI